MLINCVSIIMVLYSLCSNNHASGYIAAQCGTQHRDGGRLFSFGTIWVTLVSQRDIMGPFLKLYELTKTLHNYVL